jgi:sec-independent protein translocase protein TatA
VRFAAAAELLAAPACGCRRELDDPRAGFALVEDLGPATLYETREPLGGRPADELDRGARAARSHRGPRSRAQVAALGSPPLDAAALRRELAQTRAALAAAAGLDAPGWPRALAGLCARLGRRLGALSSRLHGPQPDADGGAARWGARFPGPAAGSGDLRSRVAAQRQPVRAPELERAMLARRPADRRGRCGDYRAAVVQRSLKAVGTFLAFAAPRQASAPASRRADARARAPFPPALPETRAAVEAVDPCCAGREPAVVLLDWPQVRRGALRETASATEDPAMGRIGLPELLIILLILVVLFGAAKIPQLGRGLGEGIRNFRRACAATAAGTTPKASRRVEPQDPR